MAFLYRNAHWVVLLVIIVAWVFYAFGGWIFPGQPQKPREIAELVLLSGGLGSLALLAYQIRFQRIQQRNDFHFNRIDAFYNHFLPKNSITQPVLDAADEMGIRHLWDGSGTALNPDQVTAIEARFLEPFRHYLDEFESLAAAVASGYVDEEFAYCLTGGRLIKAFVVLEPFIKKSQQKNPKAYVEFADLARKWRVTRTSELTRSGTVAKSIFHHD